MQLNLSFNIQAMFIPQEEMTTSWFTEPHTYLSLDLYLQYVQLFV